MFVGDYIGRRAIYTPDDQAVIDVGKSPIRSFTYAEMNSRANRLANWLHDGAGIQKGDRVAILANNGVEYLDAFFACSKIGAILVCLNWRLHWRELQQLLEDTTPTVIIYSGDFQDKVESIVQEIDFLEYLVHIDGEGLSNSRNFEKTIAESLPREASEPQINEEDVVALIFTGGTTGLPKAAQISHRMIAWNTLNTVIHDLQHGDITVNSFPMFHTGGLLVYTMPLLILGGTVILTRKFQPEQVLQLFEEYGVTVYAGVPTMYQMLTQAKNWQTSDLSTLRFCTSGGAPLPVQLVEQFQREKDVQFKQGFGMTEFGPGVFALASDDAIRKAGSIGRPNFFVDARIVDEQNQPVEAGVVGELVLRGPSLCSGYFNKPEETQRAVDSEGWFHTGDLAMADSEWYFTIVDRKKDLFISGGENIYPTEIENVLYKHPAVQMCAVIGVPDEKWGEVGKVFIILRANHDVTTAEILQHMQHHLAGYKVPKYIEFRDELPISAAGKILKRELLKESLAQSQS